MSPSPEAHALQAPLSVVADIYASSIKDNTSDKTSEDFFKKVSEHFSSVLADHVDSIPHLEDVNTPGKLARFRCMVQDTGLTNEVFVLDVGGENGRGCCAYSEGAASGSPILGYEATDYSKLRERQVIYATSIPGETAWYKSECERTSPPTNSTDALSNDLASRLNVSQNASGSSDASRSLSAKFPLSGVNHTGALVKLYLTSASDSTQDNVKATEIVDFVGVVDFSSFPNSSAFEETSDPSASTSSSSTVDQIKTLHAIYRIPHPSTSEPAESGSSLLTNSTRQELVDRLSMALEGDKVAAEWLLLSLLGKIYARRGALAIGQMPINLVLPQSMDDTASTITKLNGVLQELLPRLVKLDFNIAELNKVRYLPESKEENLISGVLQLPQGTALLVDETRMGEGNLQDRGVKNIQALATVVKDQTLAYIFPFSSFTFETDLRIIVVSKGKSLIPMECVIPVRPSTASRAAASAPTQDQLASWRRLLSPSSTLAEKFIIPEDMSEHIQNDFVKMRQNKVVTPEDLVLRMTAARLLALSKGQAELNEETWNSTRDLDETRKARLENAAEST